MKKVAIAVSIAALFGAVNMANAASTGTITFNGELTANTCDVKVNNQNVDGTVTLPTISANQLTLAGNTSGLTGFTVELENCSGAALNGASVFFQAGGGVDQDSGRLNNIGGTASNVQLQLRDGSSSSQAVIKAGDTSQVLDTTYVDISATHAILPYLVEYYATDATTPGTVITSAVYSIQYR
jgi:major type 1 subunit fimbrin (pilin)